VIAGSTTDHTPHSLTLFVLIAAAGIAYGSALPYANSWNDGSRLAAVEALVDHQTLAIDDSIFVQVPPDAPYPPYPPDSTGPLSKGTCDKLFIQGHYYSDKPAVISILMAALYQGWEWLGGPTAAQRTDLFCLLLTTMTSGLAYVVACGGIWLLGRQLGLTPGLRLLWTASFALATVALPYTRHVNNHILLLGVAALLFVQLEALARESQAGQFSPFRLLTIGLLSGLAYCLDLGIGPVLLLCLGALLLYRCRRVTPLAWCVLGALPWLAAHHTLNYLVGGTFKPMNTVPEYSQWPGCTFTPENMTGFARHDALHFSEYALGLLFGKRGFFGHNLPLFLALPGVWLLRRKLWRHAELLFALAWCAGSWLMYAIFSNNYSGACCSIRWFVPLLVPGFYLLALLLRDLPTYRWDFAVLSGWGFVLAAIMWVYGPWWGRMVPLFWPVQGLALASWLGCRLWRRRVESSQGSVSLPQERPAVRAA